MIWKISPVRADLFLTAGFFIPYNESIIKKGIMEMSLTVLLYYTGTNGNARKFAEEMMASGVVDAVRAEEGNERYEYFFPAEDPETVLLIDRWRDQAALDFHHKSPMMESIAALREKYRLRLRVERYIDEKRG